MARVVDEVAIRLSLLRARAFQRDADKSARSIGRFGEKTTELQVASTGAAKGLLSLAPAVTAVGGSLNLFASGAALSLNAINALLPATFGLVAAGGGIAASAAQGFGVYKLAVSGVGDALGGLNEEIDKKKFMLLTPEAQNFVLALDAMRPAIKDIQQETQARMFPGLTAGFQAASKNAGVFKSVFGDTASVIGGLGRKAGQYLGSTPFAEDFATLGAANARILGNLGGAVGGVAKSVIGLLVAAAPLTEWLTRQAASGAGLLSAWIGDKRETGALTRWFARSRTDLASLGRIVGQTAHGLAGIFGQQSQHDAGRFLASVERGASAFNKWANGPAMKGGIANAINEAAPEISAALANVMARALVKAGTTGAGLFWSAFWKAEATGKLFLLGIVGLKTGALKAAAKGLGNIIFGQKGGKGGGALSKAKPLPVWVVNPGFGGPMPKKGPGALKKWGGRAATAGGTALATTGGTLAAGVGASLAAPVGLGLWARHSAGKRRAAGATPLGDQMAASRQTGGANKNVYLDKQGFPTSKKNASSMIPKGGSKPTGLHTAPASLGGPNGTGRIDVVVPLHIDGKEVARAVARANANTQARRKGRP